jgi:hypothetical protein
VPPCGPSGPGTDSQGGGAIHPALGASGSLPYCKDRQSMGSGELQGKHRCTCVTAGITAQSKGCRRWRGGGNVGQKYRALVRPAPNVSPTSATLRTIPVWCLASKQLRHNSILTNDCWIRFHRPRTIWAWSSVHHSRPATPSHTCTLQLYSVTVDDVHLMHCLT